jgi:hypothetical protein
MAVDDVAIAAQHIRLGIGRTGREASLPKRVGALVARVEDVRVAAAEVLHEPRDAPTAFGVTRRYK